MSFIRAGIVRRAPAARPWVFGNGTATSVPFNTTSPTLTKAGRETAATSTLTTLTTTTLCSITTGTTRQVTAWLSLLLEPGRVITTFFDLMCVPITAREVTYQSRE